MNQPEPEIDICSDCKEHCEFEKLDENGEWDENEEWLSNCCGSPPYNLD